MSGDRRIGLELQGGHAVGRDPRRMTGDELMALGHVRISAQKALRLRCIDCSGGSAQEVRLCTAVFCPAWPFRMGRNPWRAPASDERRERARATIAARRAFLAADRGQGPGPDATEAGAATPVAAGKHADKATPVLGAGREERL